MQLNEYERFIPVLKDLAKKIYNSKELTKDDKTLITAMISNQIHIQSSSAEIITYEDVDIISFIISDN